MSEQGLPSWKDLHLFIEWPNRQGLENASLEDNLEHLREESQKAMNITMGVIHVMADKVSTAIDAIEDEIRPDEMEFEFSLKLDLEGGTVVPMIAKTTTGGQFNIKFKWTLEKPNRPTVLVSENK